MVVVPGSLLAVISLLLFHGMLSDASPKKKTRPAAPSRNAPNDCEFHPANLQLLYDRNRHTATRQHQAGFLCNLDGKIRETICAIVNIPMATMKNATVGSAKRWSAWYQFTQY